VKRASLAVDVDEVALNESFHSCLHAAQAGAEGAWTAIYRDLAPSLLGYFRAQGAAEPEDLTGEVFMQVVRHLARFEGSEKDLRAWVFTIAHNRLVDDRRYRSRRPTGPLPDGIESRGPVGDTEREALRSLAVVRVREVIDHLSPHQRDVILLRIVADLPIEVVAEVLGKTPSAVKALQRRGLATVQREISREAVSL
jgi:RNA polymerase sigma factor (sigma-70 family)